MIYLIIALILLGSTIALLYGINKPKKKGKETTDSRQYQYFITFFLSILSVFIGAFLAFQLSDFQTQRKEKNYLLDLISRTNIELESEKVNTTMLYDYFTQKPVDEAQRRMNANPVSDVFGLNILINTQEFSKYISPLDIMLIQDFTRQKEKLRGFMNNEAFPLKDRIDAYKLYSKFLEDIKLMLSLESDYLKGKISYKDLLDKLNQTNFINNNQLKGFFDDKQYGIEVPIPPIQLR